MVPVLALALGAPVAAVGAPQLTSSVPAQLPAPLVPVFPSSQTVPVIPVELPSPVQPVVVQKEQFVPASLVEGQKEPPASALLVEGRKEPPVSALLVDRPTGEVRPWTFAHRTHPPA